MSVLVVGRYSGALDSAAMPLLFLRFFFSYSLVNMNNGTNSLVGVDHRKFFNNFIHILKLILL